MKKLVCVLMMMFSGVANAGHLAEGLRGKKWGEVIAAAPGESCGQEADGGWICKEKIGDVEVDVAYATLDDHRLYSIIMVGKGFSGCDVLAQTLVEAWGRGSKDQYDSSPLPKTTWFTMGAIGSFDYNRYSERCTILAMSTTLYREKERAGKKKAAEAASSL